MQIQPLHPNFNMPTRGTDTAGGYDIYMPDGGSLSSTDPLRVKLGFAAAVPPGHVALLLPRSSAGGKNGISLRNTCGVIDSDYRGEWMAILQIDCAGLVDNEGAFTWQAGERLLQFVIVPVATPELESVESLTETNRGTGGFGSTGN